MTADALNAWICGIGCVVLIGTASWMDGAASVATVHAEATKPAPSIRPYSERMGCPPWTDGLSRSVTIIATEDEHGALTGMQCIRVKERGKVRGM